VRVAWIGPAPSLHSGATFVGTQLLHGLAEAGVEVDCFLTGPAHELPPLLFADPRIGVHAHDSGWKWDRWYSRKPMIRFFSGNLNRVRGQLILADRIVELHRERPYDVLYQFSQTELLALRRRVRDLPPIMVHPSTHAAGELLWHRSEAALSRRCESLSKRSWVRAMLVGRAFVQRRDVHLATRVVGVSARFVEHLARDYEIEPERLGVVRNPIDLERFQPGPEEPPSHPIELLFVSRMSARKGVELVVELSHRLADLAGSVRIRAIGAATTWSDYRPLLEDLNPDVATYEGRVLPEDLSRLYETAGAVLQPSLYEPFALTIGEGLASGTPAIASDEVGAIDGVDPDVCRVFPSGDMDAFEASVRGLLADVEAGRMPVLRRLARREAERLFAVPVVTRDLIAELERTVAHRDAPEPVAVPAGA
jgi:glycosyltransferase involved in cell wall biosynthesis